MVANRKASTYWHTYSKTFSKKVQTPPFRQKLLIGHG